MNANTPLYMQVPATSANLGPGFDCLGVAWRRYNRFRLRPGTGILVSGPGNEGVSRGSDNLAWQAVVRLFRHVKKPLDNLALEMRLDIPPSRGLGSSASAVVGGLMAANHWLGTPLTKDDLFPIAVELEGHPDNIAPALYGGLQVSVLDPGGPRQLTLPWPDLVGVLAIPPTPLATDRARAALPEQVSHRDARFNLAHASLMVAALTSGRLDLLPIACQDRLHEPFRAPLVPGLAAVKEAARLAGALAACLSGAGPTALALATPDKAPEVAQAMLEVWHNADVVIVHADDTGASPVPGKENEA